MIYVYPALMRTWICNELRHILRTPYGVHHDASKDAKSLEIGSGDQTTLAVDVRSETLDGVRLVVQVRILLPSTRYYMMAGTIPWVSLPKLPLIKV